MDKLAHQTIYVPLDAPLRGWMVANTYRYKVSDKVRFRSCSMCKIKKATCSAAGKSQARYDRCTKQGLDCFFSLSEPELHLLKKLEDAFGERKARFASGLKEYAFLTNFLLHHPEYTPNPNLELELPPFSVLSNLCDEFFAKNPAMQTLNPWLLERHWQKAPILIPTVAMLSLTWKNVSHDDNLLASNLLNYIEHWILSDHACEDWVKLVVIGAHFMHANIVRPLKNFQFIPVTYGIAREFLDKSLQSPQNTKWLTQQADASLPELMQIDAIRRVMWLMGTETIGLHWAVNLHNFPWQLRKKIPIFSSDNWFCNFRREWPCREAYPDVRLDRGEWQQLNTLAWLALPRGPERTNIIQRIVDSLEQYGPFAWTYICVHICIRACRGDAKLWPNAEVWEEEVMEKSEVHFETWISPMHWYELVQDIIQAFPQSVQDADTQARGDILIHLGMFWWGKSRASRLLVGLNLLREARIGALIRMMRVDGVFTEDDYLADAFMSDGHDDFLQKFLDEAISLTQSFASAMAVDPLLSGTSIAGFSSILRIGYLHMIVAKRLHKLDNPLAPGTLSAGSLSDCLTTLNLVKLASTSSQVHDAIAVFEEFLFRDEEPKIGELMRMPIGALGFCNVVVHTAWSHDQFGTKRKKQS
jgi:hypothetical protein